MDGFEVLRALEQRRRRGAGDRLHRHRQLRPLRPGRAARRARLHRQGRADGAGGAGNRARHRAARALRARSARCGAAGARSRWSAQRGDATLAEQIARVAPIPSTVLIIGRERHRQGAGRARAAPSGRQRRRAPFVAVNCAALPEKLVESELFGHERGAFTGASAHAPGRLRGGRKRHAVSRRDRRAAAGAQAKLLRVLEERRSPASGSNAADSRWTRAWSPPPTAISTRRSRRGRFREDLLYRLNVHVLRVPPLRERREDVPELADASLAATCARFGVRPKRLAPRGARAAGGLRLAA